MNDATEPMSAPERIYVDSLIAWRQEDEAPGLVKYVRADIAEQARAAVEAKLQATEADNEAIAVAFGERETLIPHEATCPTQPRGKGKGKCNCEKQYYSKFYLEPHPGAELLERVAKAETLNKTLYESNNIWADKFRKAEAENADLRGQVEVLNRRLSGLAGARLCSEFARVDKEKDEVEQQLTAARQRVAELEVTINSMSRLASVKPSEPYRSDRQALLELSIEITSTAKAAQGGE